jgi:hypoxanthine-guanine phosphoribosyltransferase
MSSLSLVSPMQSSPLATTRRSRLSLESESESEEVEKGERDDPTGELRGEKGSTLPYMEGRRRRGEGCSRWLVAEVERGGRGGGGRKEELGGEKIEMEMEEEEAREGEEGREGDAEPIRQQHQLQYHQHTHLVPSPFYVPSSPASRSHKPASASTSVPIPSLPRPQTTKHDIIDLSSDDDIERPSLPMAPPLHHNDYVKHEPLSQQAPIIPLDSPVQSPPPSQPLSQRTRRSSSLTPPPSLPVPLPPASYSPPRSPFDRPSGPQQSAYRDLSFSPDHHLGNQSIFAPQYPSLSSPTCKDQPPPSSPLSQLDLTQRDTGDLECGTEGTLVWSDSQAKDMYQEEEMYVLKSASEDGEKEEGEGAVDVEMEMGMEDGHLGGEGVLVWEDIADGGEEEEAVDDVLEGENNIAGKSRSVVKKKNTKKRVEVELPPDYESWDVKKLTVRRYALHLHSLLVPHTAMLILLPSSISIHQAKVKSYGFRPGTTKRDLIIVLLRVWDALHLPPPSSPSAVSSTSKESAPDSDAPLASQSAPSTSRSRPTTASKKPRAKKQQQTLDPSTAAEEAEEPDEEFAGLFDDVGNGGEGNLSDASSSVPLASKRPSKPVKATTKAESRAAPKKQMKAVEDVEEEEEEVGATGKGSVDLPTVFKAMIQDEEDLWLRVLRYEVRFFLSLLFYLLVPPSELRADSAVILSSFSLSRSSPSTSKSSFRARFDEASRPRGGRRV